MADFDFNFSFYTIHPLTSDKLVELSEARATIWAKEVASGNATPSTFVDVEEFLLRKAGLNQAEFRELSNIGMWIAWDREVRDMTDEEKEAYWKRYDMDDPDTIAEIDAILDADPELKADMDEFREGLQEHLKQRRAERSAFDEITKNINNQ